MVAANVTFTPTIPADRSVPSGSSTRMRLARRDSTLGVVGHDSSNPDLLDDSDIASYVSLTDSIKPVSFAASGAALFSDTPIIGNLRTQGLSPRDALVSNTPNPASDSKTSIAANGYSFIKAGEQYKILVR